MLQQSLEIITVTKDDLEGISSTIQSTRKLRELFGVRQVIVDSSCEQMKVKIKELTDKEPNLNYIWQAPAGISAAFNTGLSLSKTEWVWFLNGGDEIHPDVNLDSFLYIVKESKADAIIFEIELFPSSKRVPHPPMWALWPPSTSWVPHPATIIRRRLFEQYGNFDKAFKIAMDLEFWMRCFSKNVIVDMVSIPLTKFDTNGISATNVKKTSSEVSYIVRLYMFKTIGMWLRNGMSILKSWLFYLKRSIGG